MIADGNSLLDLHFPALPQNFGHHDIGVVPREYCAGWLVADEDSIVWREPHVLHVESAVIGHEISLTRNKRGCSQI